MGRPRSLDVTPRQRIGPVVLGSSYKDVVRALGRPKDRSGDKGGTCTLFYYKNSLQVHLRDDRVEFVEVYSSIPVLWNGVRLTGRDYGEVVSDLSSAGVAGAPAVSRDGDVLYTAYDLNLHVPLMLSPDEDDEDDEDDEERPNHVCAVGVGRAGYYAPPRPGM